MLSSAEILRQLTQLAEDASWVAFLWHLGVLLGFANLALFRWRPHLGGAASLAALPLGTAAALAASSGNLFNTVVLGGVFLALLLVATRLPRERVDHSLVWSVLAGTGAVTYAFVYPHFVDVRGIGDLFFTPMGVLPCPSLALVIGLGLIAGGFGSRAWSLIAGTAGVFYALVGVIRLGVWLDLGLLLAAGVLVALGFSLRRPRPTTYVAPRAGTRLHIS